ncbi:MAG: pyruvate dehydrogenase (acetyl-transferring) E1 component subunit alpha [Alphaproteobacteria bacterium]
MDSTIARFEIAYLQYLDHQGRVASKLPPFADDIGELVKLYRAMTLTRAFDAKAVALQRTGRLGTYASSLGQEAVAVGTAAAMMPADILVPSFREHGAQLWRGATMTELLLFWGGDERGNSFAATPHDFPNSIPVGSHPPHAVGVALACKLRHEPRAVVCVFGDGATSKGDVAEALNLAGAWTLPVVFVVTNNQWAISVPRARQTAAETLAQKAIFGGITGEQVDGNDVVAVRHAVSRGCERARSGQGASWIEAVTYRLSDHTTADDASRYRSDAEVSAHWAKEPLLRLRLYLQGKGAWTKQDEEILLADINRTVNSAAEAYLQIGPQPVESIFDFIYATAPKDILAQRAAATSRAASLGKD